MTDDELARRRALHVAESYATPQGQDIIAGRLPNTLRSGGVTYKVTAGITAEDINGLVEWVEEVAEGVQWGVIYLSDEEGPELYPVWGSSSVWITSGAVRAVLAGVTGGPVPCPAPILLRADAPEGVVSMLNSAHDAALNALSRVADYQ